MKDNTETNTSRDTKPTTESARRTARRFAGATRLRLVVAAVAAVATWLSYQAANEALVVRRVLDEVYEMEAEAPLAKTAARAQSNITETKPGVAGL